MDTSALLVAIFAAIRLIGSGAVIVSAIADRRWIVLLWGVLGVLLSVPVAIIAAGGKVADLPLVVIVGGHAVQTVAVWGAAYSSRGEVGRLREVLRTAGIDPGAGRWRA